ncbi:double-cubane-cluster-containing anaerobic reductase [Negativibacillus massiliensis]|uniref:double-cubane-cluster-containing anaerobic reductase n=1 Tax=Negativibacillus massiliensis TaxID=1871035 RepID=UPI003AF2AB88|nr:2-hydroxyacyl-CoA dehydratase [Clostridium sp.]
MEVIKTLPAIFEEFSEQRRNSFLHAYETKQKNIPFVGTFCTYTPTEVIMASGAIPVGLCSFSDETIAEAEQDLPRNLCPLIKSSYGFAKTQKCPFFYFSDLIIGETTCDGKKKMYEMLGKIKDTYIMELPNRQSPMGRKLWREEVVALKEKLEEKFGVTITEEKLREQVKLSNQNRLALRHFYELMKLDPPPMAGADLYSVLYGSSFKFERKKAIDEVNALTERIQKEYDEGNRPISKRPRILVTGCPIGGNAMKVVKSIEANGGNVVCFENCGGAKSVDELVDENAEDIYQAIADRYLNIGCSCMTPNENRLKLMGRLLEEYKIDAVVEVILQACHTYNVEAYQIKQFVTSKGLPYMCVETDYSSSDVGQLNTRCAAFIEML